MATPWWSRRRAERRSRSGRPCWPPPKSRRGLRKGRRALRRRHCLGPLWLRHHPCPNRPPLRERRGRKRRVPGNLSSSARRRSARPSLHPLHRRRTRPRRCARRSCALLLPSSRRRGAQRAFRWPAFRRRSARGPPGPARGLARRLGDRWAGRRVPGECDHPGRLPAHPGRPAAGRRGAPPSSVPTRAARMCPARTPAAPAPRERGRVAAARRARRPVAAETPGAATSAAAVNAPPPGSPAPPGCPRGRAAGHGPARPRVSTQPPPPSRRQPRTPARTSQRSPPSTSPSCAMPASCQPRNASPCPSGLLSAREDGRRAGRLRHPLLDRDRPLHARVHRAHVVERARFLEGVLERVARHHAAGLP